MMAKYIDADELLNAIKENCRTEYQGDPWYGREPMYLVDDVVECINDAPAADVRENVHGEWLYQELIPNDITGTMHGECSVCHKVRIIDKFCPNCGADNRPRTTSADMRGEE